MSKITRSRAMCVPCGIGKHRTCEGRAYVSQNPRVPERYTTSRWMRCQCQFGAHPVRTQKGAA